MKPICADAGIKGMNAIGCIRTVALLMLLGGATLQVEGAILTVSVTGGVVEGVARGGVTSFKGIPFSAPPIGERRWKAPQPVIGWTGVRSADSFAPACAQVSPGTSDLRAPALNTSEDCLYLNVWTGAHSPCERRPVMVWIYGGAFVRGATSTPVYDGTQLAREGVVLVSIAYRLGPFGFLASRELTRESGRGSGNYGLLDQIAALKWVRRNITQFGGDPTRVTIFGESAGAMAVSLLTSSPLAAGLFERTIAESGAVFTIARTGAEPFLTLRPLGLAEKTGQAFLESLGAMSLHAARALSAAVIANAARREQFLPDVDGQAVTGSPYRQHREGHFNDTPILIGTNSAEGALEYPRDRPITAAWFVKEIRTNFGPAADALLAVYPHANDREALESVKAANRDGEYAWPAWTWARLESQYGKSHAYVYYFDVRTPASLPEGADHGDELPYVFGNFGVLNPAGHLEPSARAEDLKVSALMRHYWINFAATGDPNGAGLPVWPAYREPASGVMIFSRTSSVRPLPNQDQLRAFDRYFSWRRTQARTGSPHSSLPRASRTVR